MNTNPWRPNVLKAPKGAGELVLYLDFDGVLLLTSNWRLSPHSKFKGNGQSCYTLQLVHQSP
jgi:hypothetical protein